MRAADLALLNAERQARRAVTLVTALETGDQRVVTAGTLAADPLRETIETQIRLGKSGIFDAGAQRYFLTVHVPPVRLVVTGAVHISQALAPVASLAGLDVTIVDPRTAFATQERFPGVRLLAEWPDDVLPGLALDRYTAVALLTHDPRIDDQALIAALRADCFYIGALGSRKTHAKRLDRLREHGFEAPDFARIHAPVGLDIGAVSPAEIAISIVGEIIGAMRKKPARDVGALGLKFGRMDTADSAGAILAHAVKRPGLAFKKGEVLGPPQVEALLEAGVESVIAARLEQGDVHEDEAALQLAGAIAGGHVTMAEPFTGRCNLFSSVAGLVLVDCETIDGINSVDESVTVATVMPFQPVEADEMIATVKIIPFAVQGSVLTRALDAARPGTMRVAPFQPLRVGVVSTLLPGLKPAVVVKTLQNLEARLALADAPVTASERVPHDTKALSEAILRVSEEADLVIVFGASAITDRRDVIPSAILAARGRVDHLGMPVDPGNLLLLGELPGHIPVIGAPGCARSPRENGFDFVLWRLLAGLPVTGKDLRGMGVGGLLSEIKSRPQPRNPELRNPELRHPGDGG